MNSMEVDGDPKPESVKAEEEGYQMEKTNENNEMWIDRETNGDLLELGDDSMFYEPFSSLPDFPCLSSSSSSLSTTARKKGSLENTNKNNKATYSSSSSSSSSTSRAFVKIDDEDQNPDAPPDVMLSEESTAAIPRSITQIESEAMDVLNGLDGDEDLLDSTDIWDPSSLFPSDDEENGQLLEQLDLLEEQHVEEEQREEKKSSEDLAMVFFEWLKTNKESISPEYLKSIKLKRSTIECAARRLGGGKEGMMQLLKLILEWVQNHHLQKKRNKGEEENIPSYGYHQQHHPFQNLQAQITITNDTVNPNPNPNFSSTNVISSDLWLSHSPYLANQTPASFPLMGYVGDPVFSGATTSLPLNNNSDYQMLDTPVAWSSHYSSPPPHYMPFVDTPPAPFAAYPNQYLANQLFHGHGERFVKLSSATKEARKKRMARQRRIFSHHRNQNNQHHQTAEQQQQHSRLVNDSNCTTGHTNSGGKWVMWHSVSPSSPPLISPDGMPSPLDTNGKQQQQQFQRQVPSEKRQMWKPEKNLRFLLQKVLKQSDVGNLGRIVLPKKEAETHLPELDARDGISIPMEDIGTSRVWNMRYRFWPNNKSRMYLLENTGDFVRSNGLREGDFIVIYSDVKCGKYMIRGVKVRPTESKSEAKNPVKGQRKLHATGG